MVTAWYADLNRLYVERVTFKRARDLDSARRATRLSHYLTGGLRVHTPPRLRDTMYALSYDSAWRWMTEVSERSLWRRVCHRYWRVEDVRALAGELPRITDRYAGWLHCAGGGAYAEFEARFPAPFARLSQADAAAYMWLSRQAARYVWARVEAGVSCPDERRAMVDELSLLAPAWGNLLANYQALLPRTTARALRESLPSLEGRLAPDTKFCRVEDDDGLVHLSAAGSDGGVFAAGA